jgi:tRNA modification GTPase
MINAVQSMEAGMEPDLAQIDLTAARTHLKEILGSVSADDLLDTLFSKFCLGK